MSKPLIIAEKPSAARAIADALGGFARRDGFLESDQYLLSWAIGHLVELMAPEEYDSRLKRWTLRDLPIIPPWRLKVIDRTRRQFEVIRRLATRAGSLINACDAGREGELIFRYITAMLERPLPVRRLWVSSLTREALRQGFATLRPGEEYDRLYRSAECRSRGDWLVGMNATRAFTVRWGQLLSVGRVQTPTLALLVHREREIAAFVPEEYWEVWAEFASPAGGYRGKWFGPDGDRLKREEEAEAIAARCAGRSGLVETVEEKPVFERPPGLFDLTTLQREANRRFGMTAAATLRAAQELYEAKLITYPRTDSRYLTRDLVGTLPQVLASLSGPYADLVRGARPELVHPGNRRVVDDSKVTDHHAIIPTAEKGAVGGAQGRIYDLIARRFLAQFYPEARILETEAVTRITDSGDRFRARGRRVLEEGWLVCEPRSERSRKGKGEQEEEERPVLPPLKDGLAVRADAVTVEEKKTQPPRRHTEASLLSAMETAGRQLDDEGLKEAMKGRGLGTPATRAAIIERLKEVGYIQPEKKALVPTEKGHQLVARAESIGAQVLLSAELTGEWEKRIADIQSGLYDPEQFLADLRQLTEQLIRLARAGAPAAGAPETGAPATAAPATGAPVPPVEGPAEPLEVAGRCPLCGTPVVKQQTRWRCQGARCRFNLPAFLCGRSLATGEVAALLEQGRTPLIEDFISRAGKRFRAYLTLQDGKMAFEFPPSAVPRAARKQGGRAGYTGTESAAAGGKSRVRSEQAKAGSRAAGGRSKGRAKGSTRV